MRTAMVMVLLIGVVGLALTGCASNAESGGGCDGCNEMKTAGTGWCEGCEKGMVDGKETKCKGCVEAKGPCAGCKK